MKMDNKVYHERFSKYSEDYKNKKLSDRGIINSEKVERKFVLYARKSTKGKDKQQKSIQDQLSECKEFAERNNIFILNKYIDRHTARKSNSRTEFSNMITAINKGRYNAILSWHPDRLARNMKEGGEIIDLLDRGVLVDLKFPSFTFVNDGHGKVTLGIEFVLAKNYSDNLSVNTERGNKRRYLEGKGLKDDKYGYKLNKEKYYRPDGKNFELIKNTFNMAYQGISLSEIVEYLNNQGFLFKGKRKIVRKQDVSKILADPFFVGSHVIGDGIYDLTKLDVAFTPCTTMQTFMQIRDMYSKNNRFAGKAPKHTKTMLLKDLVTCKYCGHRMYVSKTSNGKGKRYLWVRCDNKDCPRKALGIRRGMRSKVVFNWMFEFIKNFNITRDDYEEWIKAVETRKKENGPLFERRLEDISKQIKEKENEQKKSAKALTDSVNYAQLSESLKADIETIELEIEDLKKEYSKVEIELSESLRNIDKNIWTYEKFVNFFKTLRDIVKKRKTEELLVKVSNMLFVNIVLGDQKVASYQLREQFAILEKVVTVTNGVDCGKKLETVC
jgi:DNA invertase Pin-like site-specific DNA recombinase